MSASMAFPPDPERPTQPKLGQPPVPPPPIDTTTGMAGPEGELPPLRPKGTRIGSPGNPAQFHLQTSLPAVRGWRASFAAATAGKTGMLGFLSRSAYRLPVIQMEGDISLSSGSHVAITWVRPVGPLGKSIEERHVKLRGRLNLQPGEKKLLVVANDRLIPLQKEQENSYRHGALLTGKAL